MNLSNLPQLPATRGATVRRGVSRSCSRSLHLVLGGGRRRRQNNIERDGIATAEELKHVFLVSANVVE